MGGAYPIAPPSSYTYVTYECKAQSTLSQKSETVAEFGVQYYSATVSLFCDSVDRA